MNVIWKAAAAAVLILSATLIETGCGDVYRPIATVAPTTTGEPSGAETEAVLSCCLSSSSVNLQTTTSSSMLTAINVSGDTNAGNKTLANIAASVTGPAAGTTGAPMQMDGTRTNIYTANTASDTVTQSLLSSSTSGFSTYTTTISLPTGSRPIGMSFQYYGATYTQDYVVNSGTGTTVCPGTGSIGVINQSKAELTTTVCIGTTANPASPVWAWISRDQKKVFVLDYQGSYVYVVDAGKYKVTNSFAVGVGPVKTAQSVDGNYIYTLNNGGGGSISIIDAVNEVVMGSNPTPTSNPLSSALPIDIAMDMNYSDTSANTQYNHVWVLQADGTVSVYDNTSPGTLTRITSMSTITAAQLAAGVYPTNIAMLRDGTMAYVGLGNTNQIMAIDTSMISRTGNTGSNAMTPVTVGVSRSVSLAPYLIVVTDPNDATKTKTITYPYSMSETTTPVVNFVAVSRQGTGTDDTPDLSKVYASTTTSTTYTYFASDGTTPVDPTTFLPDDPTSFQWTRPTGCSQTPGTNVVTCPNLYSGITVLTGAANGSTPINTNLTTIPAPFQVTYCTPGTAYPDAAAGCPLTKPTYVLGRN